MLRVYVAADCPASALARNLVKRVRFRHPHLPVEVIDVNSTEKKEIPREVFATPIYTWNGQVVFLGNPSEADLVARIGR